MLPKLPSVGRFVFRVPPHGVARFAALASLVGGGVVAVLAPRVIRTPDGGGSLGTGAPVMVAGDTQVVYGPRVFSTPNGRPTNYVESLSLVVQPTRRYTLRLVNGAADGTQRATSGSLSLNGKLLFQGPDFSSGATLTRVVEPLSADTLLVTVAGPAGAFVTVSILTDPDPTFTVYAERFTRTGGPTVTDTRSFALPAGAAPPYYLHLVNGNANGTSRMADGSIVVNGQTVATFDNNVGSVVVPVALPAQNTFKVLARAQGSSSGFLDVRFAATDTTHPAITITSPAPGLITRDSLVTVAGSVQDQTATSVAVNGQAASMTGNAFSLSARLAAEGQNTLHIVATDAAGHSTDSVRTVIRDTQQPVLTVNSPANNAVTKQTSITVSGSVTDQTAVTVNANGVPLPVDGAGQFTGQVPLAEGQSFVTVTATDAAGNAATVVRSVTRDTQAPVLTVTAPTDGAVINADHVTVTGTVTDATSVTVTGNGTALPVAPDHSFSGDVALTDGPNTIAVVATDAAGNSTTISRSVTRQSQNLPPDPATVATPINPTVATNLSTANAFLYSGPNPIQTGVAPGTIDPVRAGVIRGRVLTRNGQPLPGVTVTILAHPEFGQTLSRADGMFDLAVNGGSELVVNYLKAGFLPAQRPVAALWQDYVFAEDAALVPLDNEATVIDFAQPTEVARGSVVSDKDGARQATLIFQQGTTATLVRGDGTTQPLSSITVRATEYTVGPKGPAAMPGPLPPWSGYTYAVELSADEALGAEFARVNFNQPVALYVENFIGFHVGVVVPTGFYDRVKASWVPSANGRVIAIIDTVGPATIDVDGSGTAASDSTLAALGISVAERTRLSQLYRPGQTLWRVPVTHFSSWDCNWLDWIQWPDAQRPKPQPPRRPRPDQNCPNSPHSIIGCEDQTLGEELPVAGSPLALTYSSDRTPGYKSSVDLDVAGAYVSPHLKRIEAYVTLAGRLFADTLLPPIAPHTRYSFVWDGRDAYGRLVQGATSAHVVVAYFYPPTYREHFEEGVKEFGTYIFAQDFYLNSERLEVSYRGQTDILVGGLRATASLGGWDVSVHHAYDPNGRVLDLGDGSRRSAQSIGAVTSTVAGTGIADSGGDGGPARQARISSPVGVKVAADGSVYFADQGNHRIRRIAPNGIITTIAGNGSPCSPRTDACGDGGPATAARLYFPTGVDVGPDGSVYIGDQGDYRVRRVTPDGVITTIAGTGVQRSRTTTFSGSGVGVIIGPDGDGGPATQALLGGPISVAVGPDGSVYFTDIGLIRRVTPDGLIATMVGNDSVPCRYNGTACPDSQPALQVPLDVLFGLAFGPDGSLYTSEYFSGRVRQVTPDGVLHIFAGNGSYNCANPLCGDGGPAPQATVDPWGLALGPDGSLFIADLNDNVIRRVSADGTINTIAGVLGFSGTCYPPTGACGDGGPALQAQFYHPATVAFGPEGSLYVVEIDGHKIRRFTATMPGFVVGDIAVASADGSSLYQFDANGRHLRTRGALTGSQLFEFGYDSTGRLTSVRDRDSLRTTLERNSDGTPRAVVSPLGQRTLLTLDQNGYLSSVTNPAGETTQLVHSVDGLLSTLIDPRSNASTFAYDSLGRIVRDSSAAGGVTSLVRTESDTGYLVSLTTRLGYMTTYGLAVDRLGTQQRTYSPPGGMRVLTTTRGTGTRSIAYPDGHVVTTQQGPDPRFGMQTPTATITVTTPAGLQFQAREVRHVALADSTNPLSITGKTDTALINGHLFTSAFDRATGTFTRTSPEGHVTRSRVDAQGRLLMAEPAGLDSTLFGYDARGRPTSVTQGDRITRYAYDSLEQLDSLIDPLGHAIALAHDQAGRVSSQLFPDSSQTRFAHDASGNIISVVNPRGFTYRFTYNAANLLDSLVMPTTAAGAAFIRYRYDADRRFTSISRPEGTVIGFSFDSASRPSTLTVPEGVIRYMFDSVTGNLASVSAPNGTAVAFTYDGGLPVSTSWTGSVAGSIQATYNDDLRTATMAVNGANAINYDYDRGGRLVRAGAFQVTRGGPGGLPSVTSLENVMTSESYSGFGELSTLSAGVGTSQLFQATYTRDRLGRVTGATETVQGQTTTLAYEYDVRGRLRSVSSEGIPLASYEYDENGNRVRFTGPAGVLVGTYDARDELISYGGTAYAYSLNGEIVSAATATDTTRYTYNTFGALLSVALSSGARVAYVLDGANRRIGKKVNGSLVQGFLYQDQLRPVAELDGNGSVVSRFVYGTRPNVPDFMIKNGVTYRVIPDQAGSVRLVVNAETGEVVQRLDYDAYGNVTGNTNAGFQPFGFAGGLYDDDTKLVHFGARDYDPFTGRWTSQDPAPFVGGTNLHAYAGNDPVNFGDPSGLDPCDCSQNLLTGLDPSLKEGVNYHLGSDVRPYFAPDFADRLSDAIRLLNSWGVVPTINDAYRTAEDQQTRFDNRSSLGACDPVNGKDVCRHQLGYSTDLVVRTKIGGQWVFNPDFGLIVAAMIENDFNWGGRWNHPDWVHFENKPGGASVQERRELAKQLEDFFNNCLKK